MANNPASSSSNAAWFMAIGLAFTAVYGPAEGMTRQATLMPGILNDFKSMLMKASAHQVVTETYKIDDNRLTLVFKGTKTQKNGASVLTITQTAVNGSDIKAVFTF